MVPCNGGHFGCVPSKGVNKKIGTGKWVTEMFTRSKPISKIALVQFYTDSAD